MSNQDFKSIMQNPHCTVGPAGKKMRKLESKDKSLSRFEMFLSERLNRMPRYDFENCKKIVSDMHDLRRTLETATSRTEQYFSMCAFSKQPIRNIFLRALRYAVKSRVLHASYTNQHCFEIFMAIDAPDFFCCDTLEKFLEGWNISCSCLQFDNFMDDSMITAIKRICGGRQKYGNWNCVKNQRIRQSYFIRYNMREQRRAQANVQVVTGLEFTTGNMLTVFYNLQNSESENAQMRVRQEELRRRLLNVMNELNNNLLPNAQIFHDMATHGSFTRMLAELMHMSFALAPNRPRVPSQHPQSSATIDLT